MTQIPESIAAPLDDEDSGFTASDLLEPIDRQHTLRGTLKGALAGLACTVATLLANLAGLLALPSPVQLREANAALRRSQARRVMSRWIMGAGGIRWRRAGRG